MLLLMAGFSSTMSLAAQDDPFASYHWVIEERLVGMSEVGGAAPRKAVEIPAPSERRIAPAITIADFALKFWGGRDSEVSAAVSRLQRCSDTARQWSTFLNRKAFRRVSLRWCW